MEIKEIRQKLKKAFDLKSDKAPNDVIKGNILAGSKITGTNMYVLICAIVIASVGLNMNSIPIIIGAMLISPLMGEITAMGYAIGTLDFKLFRKALIRLGFQILVSVIVSTIYFAVSPISAASSEIIARTEPTIWDVIVATFGGLAGIIGITRKEKSNVIPGVAIATALMPPLCTVGYGIGTFQFKYSIGAIYLFLINTFCIFLSTLVFVKIMRIPTVKKENTEISRRIMRRILALAIVIIIPSIILATGRVHKTLRGTNIDRYVSHEFIFPTTEIVEYAYNEKTKELEVVLIGETIGQNQIEHLEEKAESYELKELKLKVIQGELPELEYKLSEEEKEELVDRVLDMYEEELKIKQQKEAEENIRNSMQNTINE